MGGEQPSKAASGKLVRWPDDTHMAAMIKTMQREVADAVSATLLLSA